MRVLVSDTSVLVDLERGSLLDAAFRMPFEFAVPDLLYERELKDHGGDGLCRRGLRVSELDGDGVARALRYRRDWPALSLSDCFALALAAENRWILLTGDAALRLREMRARKSRPLSQVRAARTTASPGASANHPPGSHRARSRRACADRGTPPCARRVLGRGSAGALMALARHARPAMTPPEGEGTTNEVRAARYVMLAVVRILYERTLVDEERRQERHDLSELRRRTQLGNE